MGCLSGVASASLLAAGVVFGASSARADTILPDILSGGVGYNRTLISAGFDIWRNGATAHQTTLWSPGGLERGGFTLKLLIAGGRYLYHSGGETFQGQYVLASVMPGWRFESGRLEFTVFAGPDFQSHLITPVDPENRMRGRRIGGRVGVDLWYQPSASFMTTTSATASTIGRNYWVRTAFGWHLLNLAWVGPEAMALGGDRYHQLRAGLHVTALRTAAFEWAAGFGYAYDSDKRDGLYGRLEVLMRKR